MFVWLVFVIVTCGLCWLAWCVDFAVFVGGFEYLFEFTCLCDSAVLDLLEVCFDVWCCYFGFDVIL